MAAALGQDLEHGSALALMHLATHEHEHSDLAFGVVVYICDSLHAMLSAGLRFPSICCVLYASSTASIADLPGH